MIDRNPYENDETVDIPDFAKKAKEENVDMSVFKLPKNEKDTKEVAEDEYYEEDYYEDDAPRRPSKVLIIILVVAIVVLAGLAVFGLIWGSNQKKLASEYEAKVTSLTTENKTLTNKVTELEAKITELNKTTTQASTTTTVTVKYTVSADSINVRSGAGSSNDKVKYSNLDSSLKDILSDDGNGDTVVVQGKEITVTETKTEGKNTWGKLADNVWVCLVYEGESWATKVTE